jgi:hypothetical protein
MLDDGGNEVLYSMSQMEVSPEVDLLESPIRFEPGNTESEKAAIDALSDLALVVVRATARAFTVQVREAAVDKIHQPTIPPTEL